MNICARTATTQMNHLWYNDIPTITVVMTNYSSSSTIITPKYSLSFMLSQYELLPVPYNTSYSYIYLALVYISIYSLDFSTNLLYITFYSKLLPLYSWPIFDWHWYYYSWFQGIIPFIAHISIYGPTWKPWGIPVLSIYPQLIFVTGDTMCSTADLSITHGYGIFTGFWNTGLLQLPDRRRNPFCVIGIKPPTGQALTV